ncbi:hypothetical protein [Corynebacterium sp.]|uniref:hypothetical protein n=1 Tax=Corynebacterium sp. TaxID=1720 RepID=UPI0028A6515F|nr:hypothetical protein [Corynebacterium sp.]
MAFFGIAYLFIVGVLAVVATGGVAGVVVGVGECRERPVMSQVAVAVVCAVGATLAWSYVVTML